MSAVSQEILRVKSGAADYKNKLILMTDRMEQLNEYAESKDHQIANDLEQITSLKTT